MCLPLATATQLCQGYPLPANPPGGFVFCQCLAHTVPARKEGGTQGPAQGLGWGWGPREGSCSSQSSESQLGLQAEAGAPQPLAGGIPKPEGSRGRGCPSALTPRFPEPRGRGCGPRASGKPAQSGPHLAVLLLPAGFLPLRHSSVLFCSQLFVPASVPGLPPQTPQGASCISPIRLGAPEVGVHDTSFPSLPSAPVRDCFSKCHGR